MSAVASPASCRGSGRCMLCYLKGEQLRPASSQVPAATCLARFGGPQLRPARSPGRRQPQKRARCARCARCVLVLSRGAPRVKVHLKRFQQNGRGRLRKIEGVVTFPLHLDLGPFCEVAPAPARRQQRATPSMQGTRTALLCAGRKSTACPGPAPWSGVCERQLPCLELARLAGCRTCFQWPRARALAWPGRRASAQRERACEVCPTWRLTASLQDSVSGYVA